MPLFSDLHIHNALVYKIFSKLLKAVFNLIHEFLWKIFFSLLVHHFRRNVLSLRMSNFALFFSRIYTHYILNLLGFRNYCKILKSKKIYCERNRKSAKNMFKNILCGGPWGPLGAAGGRWGPLGATGGIPCPCMPDRVQ
jgi:chromate transport protein ChrA